MNSTPLIIAWPLEEHPREDFSSSNSWQQEKDRLADAEVALKKTEESTGVIAPSGQTETIIRQVAQLQAEITRAKWNSTHCEPRPRSKTPMSFDSIQN